jgi:hypothetical protein
VSLTEGALRHHLAIPQTRDRRYHTQLTHPRVREHWALCGLLEIEVRDHAGLSLHPYRDIVVRRLLGFY